MRSPAPQQAYQAPHQAPRRPCRWPSHPLLSGARVALAVGTLGATVALPAAATALTATQLTVFRDGGPADWLAGNDVLLADSFDNGDPLLGPAFTSTGAAATYSLQGLDTGADPALALRETGGALLLDPAEGADSPNAAGASGRSIRLRLLTNITDAASGLARSRSFATSLNLSLASLPVPGGNFGLRLTDAGIGANTSNDIIELSLVTATNGSGNYIVFRKQDFLAGTVVQINPVTPLVVPAGAAGLVLALSHVTANSDTISASYGFAASDGSLIGNRNTFASTTTAFQGEDHTRIEIRATQPVPEPAAWALWAAGALGLAARRRRAGR